MESDNSMSESSTLEYAMYNWSTWKTEKKTVEIKHIQKMSHKIQHYFQKGKNFTLTMRRLKVGLPTVWKYLKKTV